MATILVIDDDATLLLLLQRMLVAHGHTVTAIADGPSGLRHARDCAPDLVLTDINMPETDGFEIISALRLLQPGPRVIAMSGGGLVSRESLLQVARNLGALNVLFKPFDPETLKETIDAALNADENAAATPQP